MSSQPASNAVASASTNAMSPPVDSSSNDPEPPVELDRSMFTKEKAINMPNMGKFRGEFLFAESTLKVSIVILYICFHYLLFQPSLSVGTRIQAIKSPSMISCAILRPRYVRAVGY